MRSVITFNSTYLLYSLFYAISLWMQLSHDLIRLRFRKYLKELHVARTLHVCLCIVSFCLGMFLFLCMRICVEHGIQFSFEIHYLLEQMLRGPANLVLDMEISMALIGFPSEALLV